MYECCNVKRFFRLLVLDLLIFSICAVFFLAGKSILMSVAGNTDEEPVFLPVIMYHNVGGNEPSDYIVTPEQLESDLKWLSENGCNTVTAQQLADYTKGIGILPERPVMITLDDGFYNNLSVLLPLLEKYDMKAVVSVVGSYTDNDAAKDPHNDRYSYLTWEDICELSDSGRIETGNHTYNMHSLFSGRTGCSRNKGETEEEYISAIRKDIGLMQDKIKENTGSLPFVFAYPFGAVSRESIPVLKDMGILITLTCRELPNYITRDPACLYGIGRYNRSGFYSTHEFMEKIFKEN